MSEKGTEKSESKGGFGRTILGLLVKTSDDDDPSREAPEPRRAPAPGTRPGMGASATRRVTSVAPITASSGPAQPDPEIRAQLEKAMLGDNDNSVGRLLSMMDSLAEDIADPKKLLRASLKALKGQGCTPENILADIASDAGILTAKEREFQAFMGSERQTRLGGKQTEATTIGENISKKRREIEALEREIAALTSRQAALETETEDEARHCADVESRFDATLAAIRKERSDLETRIKTIGEGV